MAAPPKYKAIKVQSLFQKVLLLQQHSEHKQPFLHIVRCLGLNEHLPAAAHKPHQKVAGRNMTAWSISHDVLVWKYFSVNTLKTEDSSSFCTAWKQMCSMNGFFFSSPLSLIKSRKVSTIDRDDFLMIGTSSVPPTQHTLVTDKLSGQLLCQGTKQRCPAKDPTPFSSASAMSTALMELYPSSAPLPGKQL